ncbi:MAG: tyrosine-type recombinase/integrase [Phycisphaerales bacterium]|nr:tyrosine-type recombinase/integrase [Phycisphaerales bacterium]
MIIAENPFADVQCGHYANTTRYYFVSQAEAQAVLDACPDAEWRLLFALCRFGGLRCPSEVLRLTWADIDWEHDRFTVHASKTEHHADGGIRQVPIFPELAPHLTECFEAAEPGSEYVITRYRNANVNLRTQLNRIIKRAGLMPWPKLFQNLRSTRETELVQEFPIHVVCKWIGNSTQIASKHYLQVTEDHFAEAAQKAVHYPVQYPAASACTEPQVKQEVAAKPYVCGGMQKSAAPCDSKGLHGMTPRRLELRLLA